MKRASFVLFLGLLSQPVLAGQNWSCEGKTDSSDSVAVVFETRSNTVIANTLVMRAGLILSRRNAQLRRDAAYRPIRYNGFNRFNVAETGNGLFLLLPKRLASLDDEFTAHLQVGMGTATAHTVVLTCTGAG